MNINPTMLIRKLNVKNINPQNIGYVLKDGTVNFQSESAAFNFARNMVDKALKAKEPFERAVLWKDSRVHLIADGTADGILASYSKARIPKGASSIHGHIVDRPLSMQDYATHMGNNMNVSYVLCPSGKYSKITSLPGEDINKTSTKNKINQMYKESKITRRNLELQLRELLPQEQAFNSSFRTPQNPKENSDSWQSMIKNSLKEVLTTAKNCQLNMWEKNSGKKSGVIFETNLDKNVVSDNDVARYYQTMLKRALANIKACKSEVQ